MSRVACVAALLAVLLAVPAPPRSGAGETGGDDQAEAVRVAWPADDGTLTPYTFELAYPLVTLVYDTLLWRDPEGIPQPWLAESVEVSDDGLTVTIRLREGARWHDGQPVTANDVAFTFAYVAERFHPRFTPQLDAVEDVAAVDDTTAVVTLRRPAAGFADQPLADLPILPAHLWADLPADAAAPAGLAVGSGPYRLAEHDAGQGYRFEADPDYLLGAPLVDTVEVAVVDDLDGMLRALHRGEVDLVPVSLPGNVAEATEGPTVKVATGPSYAGTALLLNTRRAPFGDPGARRAVAAALDLHRIARAVGSAVAADRGYLHPASRWAPDEALHTFDPDEAAPGLAELASVTVLAPEADPVRGEAARQVALALGRAGVDARVEPLARDELGRAVGEDGSEPDFDAAVWPIPPLASYDPAFLDVVFGSDPDRAVLNYTGYRSAAFDDLAAQVATTLDPADRQAAIDAQQALLAADAPAVPLLFPEGAYAHRPAAYDGWVYVAGTGLLDKRSFLALDARASRGGEAPGPGEGRDGAPEEAARADGAPAPRRGLPGPLGLAAIGLLGVALALGAAELARRR